MPNGTYIDPRLINRIQSAEVGACMVVASEAEEKQALRYIELTRARDGLTVRVERVPGQQGINFDDS